MILQESKSTHDFYKIFTINKIVTHQISLNTDIVLSSENTSDDFIIKNKTDNEKVIRTDQNSILNLTHLPFHKDTQLFLF